MSTLRPDEKDHRIALLLAKVKEMEDERVRLAAALAEAKLEAKEACDLWEGAKKTADTLRTELAEARRELDARPTATPEEPAWNQIHRCPKCEREWYSPTRCGDCDVNTQPAQQSDAARDGLSAPRELGSCGCVHTCDGLNAPPMPPPAGVDPEKALLALTGAIRATQRMRPLLVPMLSKRANKALRLLTQAQDCLADVGIELHRPKVTSDSVAISHPAPAKPESK